ncbi:MAG: dihydroorotase [Acidiferrobacterales bacterium]|nr:dihydroorotase [Acidiferrobacterales bacterium]
MKTTAIRNGRVIDPANGVDSVGDVFVRNHRVADPSEASSLSFDREIDASGLIVCPGLIDLNAKMGERGSSQSSTLQTESKAALSGGITTACIQPDTQPVVDTPAMAHMIRTNMEQQSGPNILPLGALTIGLQGETLTEMAALKAAGCVGVSNARSPVRSTLLMRRAMQYASTFDITVFIHSFDPWLAGNGCVHEGEISTRLGLPAVPEAAETVAVARDLALVETTGVRAHFSQISCARSVSMIAESKRRGLNVSADVAVHNLLLTEFDVEGFDTMCHVQPPLRSEDDRSGLRQGLRDGSISVICSDHRPCRIDDKLAPFVQTAAGISGLETLLPLTLKLVDEGAISLTEAIACLTCNPAAVLGIETGSLTPGSAADICIFDPERTWTVNPDDMLSGGRNTPFAGTRMRGRVTHTFSGGKLVVS